MNPAPPPPIASEHASASAAPSSAIASEQALLTWTAPEFIKQSRGGLWFAVAGLTVAALIVYAIQTHSFTMAMAFIVLAGVYLIAHHREPIRIQVKLTTLGFYVGTRKIPYNHIKAFWVVYHPPKVKILKLLTTDHFLSELTIQLDGQDPGEVRSALIKQIPEYEGRGENFIDGLIRHMKL